MLGTKSASSGCLVILLSVSLFPDKKVSYISAESVCQVVKGLLGILYCLFEHNDHYLRVRTLINDRNSPVTPVSIENQDFYN